MINNGWEETNADHHIRSLNIKTPGAEQLIMNLSGGNQQKAILGRWLSEEMKVILWMSLHAALMWAPSMKFTT